MEANPHLRGVVYDLPHIASSVESEASGRGLAWRMTGVGGDFFTDVPAGDLYLVKFILHDWSYEECVTILSNVRAGMRHSARCNIAETMVSEAEMTGAALMDLAMLAAPTGQERDQAQFKAL